MDIHFKKKSAFNHVFTSVKAVAFYPGKGKGKDLVVAKLHLIAKANFNYLFMLFETHTHK